MQSKLLITILLAGVLMGSCGGKEEPVKETLSLDTQKVEASKEMAGHKIGVSSNTSWTVTFTNENGEEAVWGVLDRTSGSGDATITLRLYENKFKNSRQGVVTFTTKGGLTASVSVTQKGDSNTDQEEVAAQVRIGSYNMRGSWLTESEAENAWEVRKERMHQSFMDCAFDIVGLQEVGSAQQSWLTSTFAGTYSFKFFSPYSQTGTGDRGQGIGWRTDAFTVSGWHYFWLGDEPGTMSSNDTGTQGNFKRGGCCLILTHKTTGLKLFIMNTHGCLNSEWRTAYAPQYEIMEKKYNVDGLPSFFTGDMNSSESTDPSSPYVVYTSYWKDSFKEVAANKRFGIVNTYNGYTYPQGKSRIDMIFFRGSSPISIDTYTCSNTLYSGLFASDHFPVYIDATITN